MNPIQCRYSREASKRFLIHNTAAYRTQAAVPIFKVRRFNEVANSESPPLTHCGIHTQTLTHSLQTPTNVALEFSTEKEENGNIIEPSVDRSVRRLGL